MFRVLTPKPAKRTQVKIIKEPFDIKFFPTNEIQLPLKENKGN